MTKEEFIAGYCDRSKIPWERLSKDMVALPCYCDEEICDGWAMVSRVCAADHMQFYGTPRDDDGAE